MASASAPAATARRTSSSRSVPGAKLDRPRFHGLRASAADRETLGLATPRARIEEEHGSKRDEARPGARRTRNAADTANRHREHHADHDENRQRATPPWKPMTTAAAPTRIPAIPSPRRRTTPRWTRPISAEKQRRDDASDHHDPTWELLRTTSRAASRSVAAPSARPCPGCHARRHSLAPGKRSVRHGRQEYDGGGCPFWPATWTPHRRVIRTWLLDAERVDIAVYDAITQTPTPSLDRGMRALTQAANYFAPVAWPRSSSSPRPVARGVGVRR